MNQDNTISVQEVRRDPLRFLDRINKGQRVTVIYHSRPFVTVISADKEKTSKDISRKSMLQYAKLVRNSAKIKLDNSKSYKELYSEGMTEKYGIS